MPEKMIEERFDQLGRQVGEATTQLEADRAERRKARKADERKTFWLILAVAVSALIAVGGVIAGLRAADAAETAQDAVDAVEETRATSRVSSCHQAVDYATAHNNLVARTQALLQAVGALSSNPETQVFVAEQVALFEGEVVRVRDCSPAGIEDFAAGTGGYLPEEP